jgi:hypothetical protein
MCGRDFIGEKLMKVGFGRILILAEKPERIFDVGGEEDIFLAFDFVG